MLAMVMPFGRALQKKVHTYGTSLARQAYIDIFFKKRFARHKKLVYLFYRLKIQFVISGAVLPA